MRSGLRIMIRLSSDPLIRDLSVRPAWRNQHALHWSLTMRAAHHRSWYLRVGFKHDPQNQLHQFKPQLGFAMQEAVVAYPSQPTGQYMLQDAPQELRNQQLAIGGFLRNSIDISKANDSVICVIADQIAFPNNPAIQITR